MHKFNELFDLSNFPKDSKYFRNDNKKVPGKMKDEYGGIPIYEFIGPKPKMHSILDANNCINKLAPNLMPKKNYVVHYRDLKYYLLQGLILKKVHKIPELKQSDWMKPYIDFNTQKRKEATNEADKILFKLLNNAVYGKTIENMRKGIKIRITTNEKDFLKYASRPTYIGHKKFGKNLVVIHEKRTINPK